ncbi:MAG: hypothetical protein ACF8NJ_11250 [Phycisphaerales bacterium JB038]
MKLIGFASACALALAAGTASAAFTAFGDQAAWQAALASYTIEELDGIQIFDMQPGGGPYVVNSDFSITVEGNLGQSDDAFIDGGEFHGEIFPDAPDGHSAYVHTFNTPIHGFGQFFDGAASGLGLRIETTEGTVDIFDYYTGFEDGWLGFVSDVPVTEVRIIGSDADGGTAVGEIYDALNVGYGVIPAPGSAALLGLAGMTLHRRRR